jgi:hypothetical protein
VSSYQIKEKSGDYVYRVKDAKSEIIPGQLPVGNQMHLSMGGQIKTMESLIYLLDNNTCRKNSRKL